MAPSRHALVAVATLAASALVRPTVARADRIDWHTPLPAAPPTEAPAPPDPPPGRPWVIQLIIAKPNLDLAVSDEKKKIDVDYKSNLPLSLGLGVSYDGLGGTLSMTVGDPTDDAEKFGRTRARDFQLHYYRGRLGVDAFYQDYQGYYLDKLPTGCLRGEACSREPKLHAQNLGGGAFFAFNERFSLKAAFEASERQPQGEGTWFLTAGFNRVALSNPTDLNLGIGGPEIRDVRSTSATVGGGYGHIWTWDEWYFAPILLGGLGYARTAVKPGDVAAASAVAVKMDVRVGAGYNSEAWFTGLAVVADGPIVLRDVSVEFIAGEIRFFGGLRF